MAKHPEFVNLLPIENGSPNYNLSVPVFVIKYFPIGAVGLVMVGLFSAAMSSLDSTINSLSATTMQDIFKSFLNKNYSEKQELYLSKILTIFWGTVCTIFAFFVGNISDSIIVSMNKIGSLANGPILGVFLLGILTTKAHGPGAIFGLVVGFAINAICWLYVPQISWPWWNAIGCVICFIGGLGFSLIVKKEQGDMTWLTYESFKQSSAENFKIDWKKYYYILAGWGIVIFAISAAL